MAGRNQYKAEDFIIAIKGSGGVIAVIAHRVGCAWNTAEKYILTYPTVKAAYGNERESVTDMAESVLVRNLQLAAEQQKSGQIVDTGDARWLLARRRKAEYSERQEVTGAGGGEITLKIIYDDK